MKVPVDECPAGPVMDAAVAKVLGLQVEYRTWLPGGTRYPVYLRDTYSVRDDGWAEHEDWQIVIPYSINVAAAWELVDLLIEVQEQPVLAFAIREPITVLEHGFWLSKSLLRDTGSIDDKWGWRATVHFPSDGIPVDAWAETVSLAICRAFLKARGVIEIEVEEESDG